MHWYTPTSLALLSTASAQVLPYNPTRIFLSPAQALVYIFQASTYGSGQSRLSYLPYDVTIPTAGWPSNSITDTLPFLDDTDLVPFTPAIDEFGGITVIAGNCSAGSSGAEIWYFTASEIGNGSWSQHQTSSQELGSSVALTGSNFLASGITFSDQVSGGFNDTSMFVFGGMCPNSSDSPESWTSSAEYSRQMLTLSPVSQLSYVDYNADYNISMATSRGPPIAEAGFSITPLSPSYSEAAMYESQTQQQDFVLLGGHTQAAFINMSQVALFSLPQESWTFLPVSQPSTAKTDLAARQAVSDVEPRSGHTAILSEDGNSVVLFGGWVGDVATAAQPQLAILHLGSGYGGAGDWSWEIPTAPSSGSFPGLGMYGHGATLLPGGIMFIAGGYAIPAPSSTKAKRVAQDANSQIYFYNVSSNSWLDSYVPPAYLSEPNTKHGLLSKTSQQAGLGAGLGIGLLILITLVVFYFWYTRRLKRAREARGRALLSRSSDGSFGQRPVTDNGAVDGRGGNAAAAGRFWNVWDSGTNNQTNAEPQMQQVNAAGSTSLGLNIPSPTRGLRKGMMGKNYQYQAAPRYEDNRMSRGSGNISTIRENDEEEEWPLSDRQPQGLTDAERKLKELERVLNSNDPFADPEPNPLGSHPVSPELGQDNTIRRVSVAHQRRESIDDRVELPAWSTDRSAAEPLLRLDTGRVSPSKSDERTSSTLSEHSNATAGSVTRTMSTRTGALLAAAAAARATSNHSPEHSSSASDGRTATMSTNGGRKSPYYYHTRTRSSTAGSVQAGAPTSAGTDADSFMTARTTFGELQSEGEALLGGRPTMDRDDPYQRALAATHSSTRSTKKVRMYDDFGELPPMPRRQQGFLGSLRRALVAVSERSFSLTGSSEQYAEEQRASSTSPTKDRTISGPRRTVSDGGTLLKQKRGQKDWEDNQWPRYCDDPDPGDWGESSLEKRHAEDDWDVEGAASKRDVQVMFTIPKSRLRVVNDNMDRASLRSASDSALSRTGSLKGLHREESIRTLRTKSEGDRGVLTSTVEEEKFDGQGNVDELLDLTEKEKAA
ncbi:hypothetical protein LTR56_018190 [Elasticomyces elasticus]|nr:hypothetical protein LTR56_018190 [Elasticomyces elasticus]KAK3665667.1 hypothetical protein LTR22_003608 [Elasticomyces elasticus]KAK4930296.1 hypothetical protein LTR49_003036 [Elasticomyces elasticus]KAK5749970.1 hypothetical protein LTS12_019980 [Elasticomyces elasticus]